MSIENLQANSVHSATTSELDKIRKPDLIFTDGYLNDPIKFSDDLRFHPTTIVQQLSMLPSQIQRDFADYLQIDRNQESPQLLSISMFSRLHKREAYNNVMGARAKFTQFGVNSNV